VLWAGQVYLYQATSDRDIKCRKALQELALAGLDLEVGSPKADTPNDRVLIRYLILDALIFLAEGNGRDQKRSLTYWEKRNEKSG
jgi:hypothetical protein